MLKGVYLVFISLEFAKNYLLYTHFDFYTFRLENKGTRYSCLQAFWIFFVKRFHRINRPKSILLY